MKDDKELPLHSIPDNPNERASQSQNQTNLQNNSESVQNATPQKQQIDTEQSQSIRASTKDNYNDKKPRSKLLVNFLRFLVVGGGVFMVFIIGLGLSFSACFTIKGPTPPECGPVSFVSLLLMPGASLFFLIPLAKKIK